MKLSHRVFNIGLVAMFCVLALQLYRMQIIDSHSYREQAKGNRERIITKQANRGIIYDRNGKRLVVNNPSYSVAITPADLPDTSSPAGKALRAAVFAELARILGTHDVVALTPNKLPADKVGEVANRLSVLLQVPAETLRPPLKKLMQDAPSSDK